MDLHRQLEPDRLFREKDRTPWGGKNLREKAKVVGLEPAYDVVFGGMSHNVHGAWQDLYQFHLQIDGDQAFMGHSDEWPRSGSKRPARGTSEIQAAAFSIGENDRPRLSATAL